MRTGLQSRLVKVLNDLLSGHYQYAGSTRLNEYKAYDDFKERFLSDLSENEKLALWESTYFELSDDHVRGWHWLATSFGIPIFKRYIVLLKKDEVISRTKVLIKLAASAYTDWVDSDFCEEYSTEEREFLAKTFTRFSYPVPEGLAKK